MKHQESIRAIILRELRTLQRELEAYKDEGAIWTSRPGIANSTGTLVLHLAGNLQSFVGAMLGNSGYVRDRRAEFESRDVSRAELLAELEQTIETVDTTLANLSDEAMARPFPLAFGEHQLRTDDFLNHLASHLAFHTGQIDYHRRLVTGDATSVGPVAIPELRSAVRSQ